MVMALTSFSSNNDIVIETVKYKWGWGVGQPEHVSFSVSKDLVFPTSDQMMVVVPCSAKCGNHFDPLKLLPCFHPSPLKSAECFRRKIRTVFSDLLNLIVDSLCTFSSCLFFVF